MKRKISFACALFKAEDKSTDKPSLQAEQRYQEGSMISTTYISEVLQLYLSL